MPPSNEPAVTTRYQARQIYVDQIPAEMGFKTNAIAARLH